MYVIVNLIDRVVEVYTRPLKTKKRYGHVSTLNRNQTLTIPAARGKGLDIPVGQLRRADRRTR